MSKITPPEFSFRILRKTNARTSISNPLANRLVLFLIAFALSSGGLPEWREFKVKDLKNWSWEIIKENEDIVPPNQSHWSKRAGLQALNHMGKFYIFGGRTPLPLPIPGASIIHGDVWSSSDKGKTWSKILASNPSPPGSLPDPNSTGHWANRAYFQAVQKGSYMYVLGGQDFNLVTNPAFPQCQLIPNYPPELCTPLTPVSQFFNDVWRSRDGINWTQMIQNQAIDPEDENPAHWVGRAGLSAAVFKGYIYVMGGSLNDDSAIIGGPPERIYFNDVWRSRDGRRWEKVGNAPWSPRAGGIAVTKNGYMYMIGGEEGFICLPDIPNGPTFPCPPYFNDVWRTRDGINWTQMTAEAEWDKRPGHQVVVAQNRLVLFGGFGLGDDNGATPSNPSDIWVSENGATWEKISDAPWNANGSEDIKYDFDAVVERGYGKFSDAIYTFGGDRETFDFTDPTNYLNVDNDVWKFSLEKIKKNDEESATIPGIATVASLKNFPNPFSESTTLQYSVAESGFVQLKIFDRHGRLIKTLVIKEQAEGSYEILWDGTNIKGRKAPPGLYYAKMISPGNVKVTKILLTN